MHTHAIDLHTHTTCSDGALSPNALLDRAKTYGLRAIAITDHDTIAAYSDDLVSYAEQIQIELIPGIEFSTRDTEANKYHILGFFINLKNKELLRLTERLKKHREKTTRAIGSHLIRAGWQLDCDQLLGESGVITKAHIARAVLKNPQNKVHLIEIFGSLPTEGQFIESTMLKGKPAFVQSSDELSPQEAIDTIHAAGGIALLAHPSFYVMRGEDVDALCQKFIALDIDGFEAINIQYDKSNNDREVEHIGQFTAVAEKYNMVISGGSDFHTDDETLLGKCIHLGFKNNERYVPYSVLENLKKYAQKRFERTTGV